MTQYDSPLIVKSNMSNNTFDDYCQNHICYYCSAGSEDCEPLGDACPEADDFLPLYNSMWLAYLAEDAMFQYDENDPIGIALFKCYEEQDSLMEEITNRLSRYMENYEY